MAEIFLGVKPLLIASSISEIRSIAGRTDGASFDENTSVIACLSGGTAIERLYQWDYVNIDTDNGDTILSPTAISSGSPGRWLKI